MIRSMNGTDSQAAATYAYARNRKSRNRPLEAASPLHWRFLRTARRQTGPVP